MKLYKVTNGRGDFYVAAEHPTAAAEKLTRYLSGQNPSEEFRCWGGYLPIKNIEVLANTDNLETTLEPPIYLP